MKAFKAIEDSSEDGSVDSSEDGSVDSSEDGSVDSSEDGSVDSPSHAGVSVSNETTQPHDNGPASAAPKRRQRTPEQKKRQAELKRKARQQKEEKEEDALVALQKKEQKKKEEAALVARLDPEARREYFEQLKYERDSVASSRKAQLKAAEAFQGLVERMKETDERERTISSEIRNVLFATAEEPLDRTDCEEEAEDEDVPKKKQRRDPQPTAGVAATAQSNGNKPNGEPETKPGLPRDQAPPAAAAAPAQSTGNEEALWAQFESWKQSRDDLFENLNPAISGESSKTLLQVAIDEMGVELAGEILVQNLNPAISGESGKTLLQVAIDQMGVEQAGEILFKNLNPDISPKSGKTLLQVAMDEMGFKLVGYILYQPAARELLTKGRFGGNDQFGYSILQRAANGLGGGKNTFHQYREMIKKRFEEYNSVSSKDIDGMKKATPRTQALLDNDFEKD